MNSHYIQQRTDDILRQKIALGATGGARRKKAAPKRRSLTKRRVTSGSKRACPRSRPIRRRAYTRANGTRVASTCARRPRRHGGEGGEGFEEDFYGECDIPVYHGGARRRATRRTATHRKPSPWIQHVKRYAAKHRVPYCVALMEASKSYHR